MKKSGALITAVVVVLFLGYCAWTAVLVYRNYLSPKDHEERRFVNDLNNGLGSAFGGSSYWEYKNGQAIITVYHVLEPEQRASVRAVLVKALAHQRDDIPAGLKSVMLRFCRDYHDEDVIAEFEVPAVITQELERDWGEDPRNPSTRRSPR
jgi:hypothetical protein